MSFDLLFIVEFIVLIHTNAFQTAQFELHHSQAKRTRISWQSYYCPNNSAKFAGEIEGTRNYELENFQFDKSHCLAWRCVACSFWLQQHIGCFGGR